MNLSAKNGKIFLDGKKLDCPIRVEKIDKFMEVDGKVIVLAMNLDDRSAPISNVVCYTKNGEFLWRIADPVTRTFWDRLFGRRFENMDYFSDLYQLDGKICVTLCIGLEFILNVNDGSVERLYPNQRPW